jgi:hypothetical protein
MLRALMQKVSLQEQMSNMSGEMETLRITMEYNRRPAYLMENGFEDKFRENNRGNITICLK